MRKRDLAKRTATDELQSAAAQWGNAATQMLLDIDARLIALEEKVSNLSDAYRQLSRARVRVSRQRRRRALAVRVLHQRTRGTE